MQDERGRVALVVGGSRGLGRAIVRHLAAADYRVAFAYRRVAADAAELLAELRADGHGARAMRADVTDACGVASLFDEVDQLDAVRHCDLDQLARPSAGDEPHRPGNTPARDRGTSARPHRDPAIAEPSETDDLAIAVRH